jgi:subtilisin family serine protease
MKILLRVLFLVLALGTGFGSSSTAFAVMGQALVAANAADGVLVKFRAGTSSRRMNRALSSAGCSQNRDFQTTLVQGLVHANITSGNSMQRTLNSLRNNRFVEFAEPNYLLTADVAPDDTRFSALWGLHNTGQTGGLPDADIDAPEAWDITVGSASVVIAVIDTGVDYTHSELAANLWRNPGEVAGNGIDDDGNGFVDDVRGWDFANNDNDPLDDNNHGTHVAGTIAAAGNNGVGVAGVNWRASLMALKFLTAAGAGSTAGAIASIDYAVSNGARVINASWGGGPFSVALFNAISAANNAGVLFVASAGNLGRDTDVAPSYPASYNLANIIAVAATDDADTLAGFSNFGANSVDLGAPGVSILSTILGGGYAAFSGTSMAAPHVSGVAGLVLAANPGLGVGALKAAILDGTDAVAALAGRTVSGGRLNALGALGGGGLPVQVTVSPNTASLSVGDTLQFAASGGTAPYSWSSSNPAVASINGTGLLSANAPGSVLVTATDANGVAGSSSTISVTTVAPLVVTPATATLSVGQSLNFSASGGVAPYGWNSSNPAVASIDAISGTLSAVSAGTTTVTVTDNSGASANSAAITVTNISITPVSATLASGATVLFSASGGVAPYNWSSSNPAVAGINATTGLLTALNPGTTVVTATDALGNSAVTSTITVVGVSISPATAQLVVGDVLQFSAGGGTPPYSWGSSNPAVASINATGLLTALSAGTVSVTVLDASGASDTTGIITVNAPVATLGLTPTTAVLTVGDVLQFSATGGAPPYSWSSSNPALASIDGTGLLSTLAAGTLTVSVTDSNGVTTSTGAITINAPAAILTVTPELAELAVGETLQFSATGAADFVSWSTSDPTVATIDGFGLLTALGTGSVTVTATAGGMMGVSASGSSGPIAISPAPPTVDVSPLTGSVAVGATLQFNAAGGQAPYQWSVDNPALASIDANTGLFRAFRRAEGSFRVIVSDSAGNSIFSGLIVVQR